MSVAAPLLRPARILLVEDEPADVRLFQEMLRGCGLQLDLDVVPDGDEALVRLGHPDRAPDLVVLDLNLPGLDGRDLLRILHESAPTPRTPVIVLTASETDIGYLSRYRVPLDQYMTKPVAPLEFLQVLSRLGVPALTLTVPAAAGVQA